jgi:4-amino-4-deoxy-L-arabinose transferase-like glycosyltransferase
VRVALVLATRDLPLTDDPADYHRLAVSVSQGHGFGPTQLAAGGGPTAFRSPLYPFVLGLVYTVFGVHVTLARLLQAVLGTLTVGLIGLLAHRLFGRRTALVALAIAAVYPPLLLAGSSLLTEAIALPLLLGVVLLALEYRGRGGLPWAIAAGVAVGFASLTRENYAVLFGPIALLVWTARPRWSARALVAPVAMVVAGLAVIAPWTIRNAVKMDAFIPVSDVNGFIWAGVYTDSARHDDRFPATWRPPTAVPSLRPLFDDRRLDEDELSGELRTSASRYMRDHPAYVAEVVGRSTLQLFDLTGGEYAHIVGASLGYSPGLSDAAVAAWYLLAPVAVAGVVLVRRRRRGPWELWTIPVLFVATTVVALGTYRYRAPIEPFAVCLAAFAACTAYDRMRAPQR